jgi:hypothetical protein
MSLWTITMLDTGTQTQDKGFMTYLTDMGQRLSSSSLSGTIEPSSCRTAERS